MRALRLFDSPLTPKTILEKSAPCATPVPRTRLFLTADTPKSVASAYAKNERPAANVNPFTPSGMLLTKKRTRSIRSLVGSPEASSTKCDLNDFDDTSDVEIQQPTKKVALQVGQGF